jgi:hypothetical protein
MEKGNSNACLSPFRESKMAYYTLVLFAMWYAVTPLA